MDLSSYCCSVAKSCPTLCDPMNYSTPGFPVLHYLQECYKLLLFSYGLSIAPLASLVAQTVKNLPAMRETWIQSLGWEDPLEEGMATHSSILAWRIPTTEEPGRKELDMTKQLSTCYIIYSYVCVGVCVSGGAISFNLLSINIWNRLQFSNFFGN